MKKTPGAGAIGTVRMPSKNTLTDMFCVDVGLLRPVIVTSVDALSIRPDPFGDGSWKTTFK